MTTTEVPETTTDGMFVVFLKIPIVLYSLSNFTGTVLIFYYLPIPFYPQQNQLQQKVTPILILLT